MPITNPTVYSSERGRICPKCANPIAQCTCKKPSRLSGDGSIRVMRESKGRKGKTVTLVSGLALDETGLQSLLGELKRLCGAGGAIKEGILEIQGDHRDLVLEHLKRRGLHAKKAG